MKDKAFVFILFISAFLFFSIIGIARHYSLNSGGFDLGIFDQAIWNITKGNFLESSIKYSQGGSLLGDHFEPILFLISPLYVLCPNVLVLIILQSFLIASALLPLYLIAKLILKDRFIVFAFLICYLLSTPLRGVLFNDFHPESFIVPALFWAYYFLIRKNNALFWVSIIILLFSKEDTAFLVFGIGLFASIAEKRKYLGVFLMLLSIFLWWLETVIIIPYFSPTHTYEYLSKLPFGNSIQDNFKFCITHPLMFIKFIFTKYKINYILRLLGPLCFLSLLCPFQCILIFPPLFKNLLEPTGSTTYCTFHFHYAAGIIPFVFIASIYGSSLLMKKFKVNPIVLGIVLMIVSLLFMAKSDIFVLKGYLNNISFNRTLEKIKALDLIPSDASVLATNDLCPHLSHRKNIYLWDPQEEYKILFKNRPQYIALDKVHLTSKENLILEYYLGYLKNNGYKIISNIQNGSFLILKLR